MSNIYFFKIIKISIQWLISIYHEQEVKLRYHDMISINITTMK